MSLFNRCVYVNDFFNWLRGCHMTTLFIKKAWKQQIKWPSAWRCRRALKANQHPKIQNGGLFWKKSVKSEKHFFSKVGLINQNNQGGLRTGISGNFYIQSFSLTECIVIVGVLKTGGCLCVCVCVCVCVCLSVCLSVCVSVCLSVESRLPKLLGRFQPNLPKWVP